MNISYVVFELLKGFPTVRASLLHIEVDRPMVRCTVASLTKSLQKLRLVSFWGQLGQFVLMKLLCLIFSKRHTIAKQCQQIVNPLPPPKPSSAVRWIMSCFLDDKCPDEFVNCGSWSCTIPHYFPLPLCSSPSGSGVTSHVFNPITAVTPKLFISWNLLLWLLFALRWSNKNSSTVVALAGSEVLLPNWQ